MTTIVVTFVLVMVLVSGRFIKYLAQAAAGELPADALFLILAFRLPEFLQMLLPLSIFIAMLLVLGRMHEDNEMAVLKACGIGQLSSARAMLIPMLMATGLIALFSLYVTPRGDAEVSRIVEEQNSRSALELLSPGRFHTRTEDNNQRATYARDLNREAGVLEDVFISEFRPDDSEEGRPMIVRAERGSIIERDGATYLQLEEGVQYQGAPGRQDFRQLHFQRALLLVRQRNSSVAPAKIRGWPTTDLLGSELSEARAELQWRLSLILMVPVVMLAAIPLSKSNPRQGRFLRLLPALLGYLLYMGMLLVLRSRMEDVADGELSGWLNLGWAHLAAAVLVFLLYQEHRLRMWLFPPRAEAA